MIRQHQFDKVEMVQIVAPGEERRGARGDGRPRRGDPAEARPAVPRRCCSRTGDMGFGADQDLRPRGLGAGAEHLPRDQLGLELRGLPGAAHAGALQERAGQERARAHAQRLGPRGRPDARRGARELPERRRLGDVPAALRPYLGGLRSCALRAVQRVRDAQARRQLLAALDWRPAAATFAERARPVVRPGSRRSPSPTRCGACAWPAASVPLGYKIGFTNRGIWDRYGVLRADLGPGLGHRRSSGSTAPRRSVLAGALRRSRGSSPRSCSASRTRAARRHERRPSSPAASTGSRTATRSSHTHSAELALRRRRHRRRLRPARPPLRRPAGADRPPSSAAAARELARARTSRSLDGRQGHRGGRRRPSSSTGRCTALAPLGRCDGRAARAVADRRRRHRHHRNDHRRARRCAPGHRWRDPRSAIRACLA